MNDLSPEARRTLAQAKSAQPRASAALRARVRENVLRAVAADPPLEAASSRALARLPVWTFPTLGAIAIVGGIAMFAAQRSSGDPSTAAQRASQGIELQPAAAPREATVDQRSAQDSPVLPPAEAPRVASTERRFLQDGAIEQRTALEVHADVRFADAESQSRQMSATRRDNARSHEQSSAIRQQSRAREGASARAGDSDLRAEMQLLARAEAALRADEPLSALSILETHARELSSGQLQSERAGLRLIAQCTLGRAPESALAQYLRAHRDGVLQARIRTSCARFLP